MTKKTPTPRRTIKKTSATLRGESIFESDGTYFLKLVLFALLGTLWLRLGQDITWLNIPIRSVPLGLFAGLILIRKFESHQSDRKIWYAILLVVTLVCFNAPTGIVL